MFCLETFIQDYWEKNTKIKQLFVGIIDVTLFDGVEGLNYWDTLMQNLFRET